MDTPNRGLCDLRCPLWGDCSRMTNPPDTSGGGEEALLHLCVNRMPALAIGQLRTLDASSKIVGNPVIISTSPLMHCPYCAAELVIAAGGELQCASTGALFSRSVRTQLEALRTGGTSGQPSWSYVGRWFCPCCGEQTDDSVCLGCGVVITARLARELIELNPHVSPQMPA